MFPWSTYRPVTASVKPTSGNSAVDPGSNSSPPAVIRNALTIDVEDYYQVSAFEDDVHRSDWGTYPQRVVGNTQRLLDLFETHNVQGTFFVLGWVAEQYPSLVREIASRGHELGSHSYWHRLVYRQTPDEFRTDLVRSKKVIEDAAGHEVVAYRAPSFSITGKSLWALEILVEEGFRIDSSIFPIYHDRYGIPDARRDLHAFDTARGEIWEFPAAVHRILGVNLPISGGGYFRLLPIRLTTRWLADVNRTQKRPFVFYIHPWELDPDQPRLEVGTRRSRFRHYLNLESTQRKLETVCNRFCFGRLSDVVQDADGRDHRFESQ